MLPTGCQQSAAFRARVEDDTRFLETCDGGDLGTPERPSIWLLSIEPGWSKKDEALDAEGLREKAEGKIQYGVEMQLGWKFNMKAFWLLAALQGLRPEDYRSFALKARPFERGSTGYFKANLFPEPFKDVGTWDDERIEKTGFPTKEDYREWMKAVRFPILRSWIERHRPKLVICAGLLHKKDFLEITGVPNIPHDQVFTVNGHSKRMCVSTSGTVPVAIVPHFTGGADGLNSYQSMREVASRILSEVKI